MFEARHANPVYERDSRRLFWLNVAAGSFHWISFVAALIVALVFSSDVFRALVTLTTLEDAGGGAVAPVTRLLGTYRITWTVLPVPALTGTFHLALALVPFLRNDYTRGVLNDGNAGAGYNLYRWVEYSLSASLVTWNIAQVSGLCDLFVLLSLVVMNIFMQIVGGAGHELHNLGWTRHKSKQAARWWLFGFGWLPFVATWGFVATAFALAIKSAQDQVPWFVYAVVIGLFVQYSLFALPIVLHYTGFVLVSNFWYEVAYIALSFISKAYLDWIILIGSISR